jgi:hypothetical protein
MFRVTVCVYVCLLGLGCALPLNAQQTAENVGVGWVAASGRHTPREVESGAAGLVGHFNPNQMLRVGFGLQPPNMEQEKQFLQDLQTKESSEFHNFLTASEWNSRFAPSEAEEQAVIDWAVSQGFTVTQRYSHRLMIQMEAPAATIEKALGVTLNNYQLGNKAFFSNDRDPVIPASLATVIQSVGGLNDLWALQPANRNAKEPVFSTYTAGPEVATATPGGRAADGSKLSGRSKTSTKNPVPNITNGAYDPTDMFSSQAYDTNALYAQGHCCNPLGNPGGTPPETSIAIATAGTQNTNDFYGFQAKYPYLATHWAGFTYIGGTPPCCDGEGTMDFEWSTAMSNSFGSLNDTAEIYMYDGANTGFNTFNAIYSQMLADGHARVFTTSWGWGESGVTGVMNSADNILSAMAGQGWTLLAASGDGGASYGCGSADQIAFPASDPHVVAAGGDTLYLNGDSTFNSFYGWSGGPDGCGTNDGGSTGGLSTFWPTPSYQSPLGLPSRGVPDISLNADWYNTPQNIYFNGGLGGNGGTSIVAPEMAGFFANENAYLLYLSSTISGGLCNNHQCTPLGNGNSYLYWFGEHSSYAPHYPFYDITSGCNNNNVTQFYGLGYYCAGSGYDLVTGWGMPNMFELAWAINTYQAGDFGAPGINFSGPAKNRWYNSDQTVSWSLFDTSSDGLPPTGVAGFSQAWDADPGDVFREATPGSGNSFYSGPQFPNATTGCLDLAGADGCGGGAGQGWHTVNIRAWDNTGFPTVDLTYGPIGYDTVAPVTAATLKGTVVGGIYESAVTVTLAATDALPGSGVAHTVYQVNGGSQINYTGPFQVSSLGTNTVAFHSLDNAGNVEPNKVSTFQIEAPTGTTLGSSVNPSSYHQLVTLTAKVAASFGGAPNGSVQFKDGNSILGTAALNAGGIAQFPSASLGAGIHSLTAVYLGSSRFLGGKSAALKQTVKKATTTTSLVSSPNPSIKAKPVTFTATAHPSLGGAPSGQVTFKNGTTVLGSATLNATTHTAKFTTSKLLAGTFKITATYDGDTNFLSSASPVLKQVVKP